MQPLPPSPTVKNQTSFTGPDSLVVRASASGMVGRWFWPRRRHTKGGKNGTGSSLADARNKRVVPGRYKKAGGYLLDKDKEALFNVAYYS